MTGITYFIIGIFFSVLLMMAIEVAYGAEGSVEIIAYADDAAVTLPIIGKSSRVLETTAIGIENNDQSFSISKKTTSTTDLAKPLNQVIIASTIVTEANNKAATLATAKPRVLSRSQMNEAGAKMFKRLLILPIMYSNIRKKH